MSKEAKVGIFVLLGIVTLTFFTFRVSKMGGIAGKGYKLIVSFETAAGLEPKGNRITSYNVCYTKLLRWRRTVP